MVEFINTVVSVSLAAALSGFVAYKGADKWHKLAVSVILLSAISAPLFSFVGELADGDISEMFDFDVEIESSELERVGKEAFEDAVHRLAVEKTGLPEGALYVVAEGFDSMTMRAEQIKITLVGEGVGVDYRSLEDYIRGLGLGDCEVKYGLD